MENAPAPKMSPELLEQNPLVAVALFAFLIFFTLMAMGSLASWIALGIRVSRNKPLLPDEPWKPRVWGLIDLFLAAGIILLCQVLAIRVGAQVLGINRKDLGEANLPLTLVTFAGIGNVVSMFCIILWIAVRHRASASQIGFGLTRWAKHIGIGIVAALTVLPLVYALMAVVSVGMKKEYNHPLLDAMKNEGSLQAYLLAVLSAAIIAPVVEEFLFRVLLQGWLQSWQSSSIKSIMLGASEADREHEGSEFCSPQASPTDSRGDYSQNIDSRTSAEGTSPNTNFSQTEERAFGAPQEVASVNTLKPPLWPAFLTGTLFGLAHLGYGFSFIPLIFLGIILGLLYRATHSIWPSLMVHFILNSSSMIALGVGVLVESVTKK